MSTLTLILRQPAQLGDRPREDFVLSTLEHLPGSAVRGAFAAAWIARNGVPDARTRREFLRLFEGGVRFGALLRAGTEAESLAVVRHKYVPEDSCRVTDYDRAAGDDPPLYCPDCGSPLEPARGIGKDGDRYRSQVRRRTSVAIGETGVARRGQLFTRETLLPGQDFTGTLAAGDPADLEILRSLGPVRVGGRRTTHGLADVAINGPADPPAPQQLDGTTLVLRLRSPGIFTDELGRPRPEPGRAELSQVLGVAARVERRWTRWQEAGGWHVASGLPKPAELAVAAGSAFLIKTERPVAAAALSALAERGVGLRRHEGFGDLAGPPVLRAGLSQRQARERKLRQDRDAVAPLAGVPVRFPQQWPGLRELLARHISGDHEAAAQLRQQAGDLPDDAVRGALRAFLSLPREDAASAARELGLL